MTWRYRRDRATAGDRIAPRISRHDSAMIADVKSM